MVEVGDGLDGTGRDIEIIKDRNIDNLIREDNLIVYPPGL